MVEKNNYYSEGNKPNPNLTLSQAMESRQFASGKTDHLTNLSFDERKTDIRKILIELGTDAVQNDNDLTGNGDQALIRDSKYRDVARHLFSSGGGGDIHQHFAFKKVSQLAMACATGMLSAVQNEIKQVKANVSQPYSRSKAMNSLLETRETSFRLSPLLGIVSIGKGIFGINQRFQDVAKLLLKNGASPVAQDVLGKTVVHYGAGGVATKMTLEVVDMCIRAAKSHHLFGKDVKLHNLNTESMNGKVGIAGGFDPDLDRRSVYLPEEQREVWVKVENISLLQEGSCQKYPLLSEMLDRMGGISLHELCMPKIMTGMDENYDAAKLLLKKHHTSIYIKAPDGCSPFHMCSGMSQMIGAEKIAQLVMDAAVEYGKDARKARKQSELRCAKCMKELGKNAPVCSRCKITCYCSRDCQVSDWSGHKMECKDLASFSGGVKLNSPNEMRSSYCGQAGQRFVPVNFQRRGKGNDVEDFGYQKPKGIKCKEQFVIKVQGNDETCPILIYDQTHTCKFFIDPDQLGFKEILTEIHNEPAYQGRKTFMKASFDEEGICTVYPNTAGVKSQYNW